MDRILELAAKKVIADLATTGGGTYESRTLIPFTPTTGYAVGIGGLHLDAAVCGPENIAWALRAVGGEYETSYVGTWLDSGVVYFDAVEYFGAERRAAAIIRGMSLGQQAIFDFAMGESLILDNVGH